MMQAFSQLPHPLQALLATLFTWGITAAGAAMVFCCKNIRHDVLDGLLGASTGVMLAAAFWSLLSAVKRLWASVHTTRSTLQRTTMLS